jgi:hypothetical protein
MIIGCCELRMIPNAVCSAEDHFSGCPKGELPQSTARITPAHFATARKRGGGHFHGNGQPIKRHHIGSPQLKGITSTVRHAPFARIGSRRRPALCPASSRPAARFCRRAEFNQLDSRACATYCHVRPDGKQAGRCAVYRPAEAGRPPSENMSPPPRRCGGRYARVLARICHRHVPIYLSNGSLASMWALRDRPSRHIND